MIKQYRRIFCTLLLVLVLTSLTAATPAATVPPAPLSTPRELMSGVPAASAQPLTSFIYTENKLVASDGAFADNFGSSVALSGNTALVGAPLDDTMVSPRGAAYVFVRSGHAWTQQARLVSTDRALGDQFGNSVALSGDTALIGAYTKDVGANAVQGAAYVFVRNGTTWTQQAKLTATDGATRDYFGYSVALSGDIALVGANGHSVGSVFEQGSAYIFTRNGSIWTQQQELTASDGGTSDYYGYSVALVGSTALVGSVYDQVGTNYSQGSAYLYDPPLIDLFLPTLLRNAP